MERPMIYNCLITYMVVLYYIKWKYCYVRRWYLPSMQWIVILFICCIYSFIMLSFDQLILWCFDYIMWCFNYIRCFLSIYSCRGHFIICGAFFFRIDTYCIILCNRITYRYSVELLLFSVGTSLYLVENYDFYILGIQFFIWCGLTVNCFLVYIWKSNLTWS